MIPSPRRSVSTPAPPQSWADFDDDDGWQDMPVVRSDKEADLDEEDQQLYHYRPSGSTSITGEGGAVAGPSNATGQHLEIEADTKASDSWRTKGYQDESDYTRLRLDEDEESEEVHMRTKYLFNEDKAMTPLSQMQATKELLTEGQRIAYVGLCQLVARAMVRDAGRGWEGWKAKGGAAVKNKLKGKGKEEVPVVESANIWMIKIMARLYQHMEVLREEQHMIESLAEHGVQAEDLVPALMTTHSVKNPEYDPKAAKEAELERARQEREDQRSGSGSGLDDVGGADEPPPPPYEPRAEVEAELPDMPVRHPEAGAERPEPGSKEERGRTTPTRSTSTSTSPILPVKSRSSKSINPFGSDDEEEEVMASSSPHRSRASSAKSPVSSIRVKKKSVNPFGSDDEDEEEQDTLPLTRPPLATTTSSSSSRSSSSSLSQAQWDAPGRLRSAQLAPFEYDLDGEDEEGGDIGRPASPPSKQEQKPGRISPKIETRALAAEGENAEADPDPERTPTRADKPLPAPDEAMAHENKDEQDKKEKLAEAEEDPEEEEEEEAPAPLPSLPGVSTSLTSADENVILDIRWTVLCDLFLVLIADSVYDARSRAFLELVAKALGFEWTDVVRFENRVTDALEIEESVEKTEQGEIIEGRRTQARRRRYAYMGLAAAGGGLVIGLSAGLLAPVIGAGLGAAFATVGISGTTGFLAGAGGAAMITTTGVLTGANIAGRGMAKRTREVRTFEFRPIHNLKRVSCYICVPGFMASKNDDVRLPFSVLDPIVGDVFSVLWEPDMMAEMGSALKILTSEVLTQGLQQVLAATAMTALMSALQWPIILTKLGYLIDNPWSNALDRSRAAGLILADVIQQRHAGVRPISLIGFSLGARSIFYALVELAKNKAYGLVQDVFIFGTTVTASQTTWRDVRSVVAGRFVNGYATNDWMLGYLFRATSGGLNTVAGLRAVDMVPGLENIDCTDTINGHMSYRSLMPQLLAKAGFPVTADHFDEPEDPEADPTVQERTIVNEADEEAKKNRKKILGIFPRSKKNGSGSGPGSKSGSGTATPKDQTGSSSTSPSKGDKQKAGEYEYDDDDADADDLPPREGDIGDLGYIQHENDSTDSIGRRRREEEDEAVRNIPKTAGFDFAAISKELGKEINVDALPVPEEARSKAATTSTAGAAARPSPVAIAEDRPPIERSGSAPPFSVTPTGDDDEPTPTPTAMGMARATTSMFPPRSFGNEGDDDDMGDIAGSTRDLSIHSASNLDLPSWDRQSTELPVTARMSPPPPPALAYNAWSPPASQPIPTRSAPPARPHPTEFMAHNPFAATGPAQEDRKSEAGGGSGGGFGFSFGAWGKKNDDPWSNPTTTSDQKKSPSGDRDQWAERNPW